MTKALHPNGEFLIEQVLEFNPETGHKRPFEIYTLRYTLNGELIRKGFRASYSSKEAALRAWPTAEMRG